MKRCPSTFARDFVVTDRLAPFHIDDGEVRVVADSDAPLVAQSENPLRAMARQINEPLKRQPPLR